MQYSNMLGVALTGPSGGPVFSWHELRGGRVLECRENFTEKVAPEAGAKFSRSVVWKWFSNPREILGKSMDSAKYPPSPGNCKL